MFGRLMVSIMLFIPLLAFLIIGLICYSILLMKKMKAVTELIKEKIAIKQVIGLVLF